MSKPAKANQTKTMEKKVKEVKEEPKEESETEIYDWTCCGGMHDMNSCCCVCGVWSCDCEETEDDLEIFLRKEVEDMCNFCGKERPTKYDYDLEEKEKLDPALLGDLAPFILDNKLDEIKEFAKDLGVSTKGTKSKIVNNIIKVLYDEEEEE